VAAPALIVVGEGAADVTPADTIVPGTTPRDHDRVSSLRLAEAEALLEPLDRLDAFPNAIELGSLRAPSSNEPVSASELAPVAPDWLDRGLRSHVFFPLLENERRPRLALGYRRADGSAGVVVSGSEPERLIEEPHGLPAKRSPVPTAKISSCGRSCPTTRVASPVDALAGPAVQQSALARRKINDAREEIARAVCMRPCCRACNPSP
jgi:hypothetical protein